MKAKRSPLLSKYDVFKAFDDAGVHANASIYFNKGRSSQELQFKACSGQEELDYFKVVNLNSHKVKFFYSIEEFEAWLSNK